MSEVAMGLLWYLYCTLFQTKQKKAQESKGILSYSQHILKLSLPQNPSNYYSAHVSAGIFS